MVAGALGAVVRREPAVPVAAGQVRRALPVQRPAPADKHPLRELVAPLLAQVLAAVQPVVEPAVALPLLLSRL